MQRLSINGMTGMVALCAAMGTHAAVVAPASVQIGGVHLVPSLKSALSHDDNVYRDRTEQSSKVLNINPSLDIRAAKGADTYSLLLEADANRYFSERDADYTDYKAALTTHNEFNSRNRLDTTLRIGEINDAGSKRTADNKTPEYIGKAADIVYGFGSLEAKARVDVFGGVEAKNYKKSTGSDTRTNYYGATAYYRLMPKTDVLFEVKQRDLEYKNVNDGGFNVTSYLVGVNWDATAKTSGFAKFGRRYRDAEASGVSDESYTGWEVGVSYKPLSYSLIQLSTGRDYGLDAEDPSSNSFTKGTNLTLSWQHDWSSRLTSNVSWSRVAEEVENQNGQTRKDRDTDTINLGLSWEVKRWLSVSAGFTRFVGDDDVKAVGVTDDSYDRNVYTIGLEASL
ncbi:outer membrane beta-barrel protein [Parendozoicomonas sp. Alg238-R29]|uniref:outer membrane beta-barrel protein n=1 Tax=Parendozoicomonas sp. Alg238-R29 TaxID=2993446 RepID=UPI00248D4E45|nr:outer membrane beta-barrel protein [Parendozoicomonas sp. Alg238-R29]